MSNVRFDFSGRAAIVTGAANGIGAACARLFGASGARVALWDVDEAAATALAREIDAGGEQARAWRCDVARSADVAAALQSTLAAFGRIDVLINNAGIFRAADFLDDHRGRLGRRPRRQPEGRLPGRPGGGAARWRKAAAARSST